MSGFNKKGWKKVMFGDMCRNLNVSETAPLTKGIERYVGLEHIEPGSLHIKSWGNIADGTTFTKSFKPGHVLFGKRRAYQKKAAVADFTGICSGDILVLEADETIIDKRLLPFVVSSDLFFDYAVKTSAGSLSPRTKFQDLAKLEFLLPPKEQQVKLTELLWATDDVLEAYREMERKGNLVFERLLDYMLFQRPKEKNSELKTLDQVAPLQRGFDLPDGNIIKGEYPVGYSNGIKKYHNEYMVQGPGIFTGRSGTIGNVFYVDSDYWPHNTSLWVTDFKGNYPRYIYYLYSCLHFEKLSAGTGVPTLNRNDIHKLKVRLINYDEQIEVAKNLDSVKSQLAIVDNLLNKTQHLQRQLINSIFG